MGTEEKLEMRHALSSGATWINGNIIPNSKTSIPVTDWELIHRDITYDVSPMSDGAFFRLDDYINSFFASMAALKLNPNMTKTTTVITDLLSHIKIMSRGKIFFMKLSHLLPAKARDNHSHH